MWQKHRVVRMASVTAVCSCALVAGALALQEEPERRPGRRVPGRWPKAVAQAPRCLVEGRVEFPAGQEPKAPFHLDGDYEYDHAPGRSGGTWVSQRTEATRKRRVRGGARTQVGPNGLFEVAVPQATTVTLWRDYDLRHPKAPYVVAPQSFDIPLGARHKEIVLAATVPPGADEFFTFKGRIVGAADDEPMSHLMVRLEQWPPGVERPTRIQRREPGVRGRWPRVLLTKVGPEGTFEFTVPRMKQCTYYLISVPVSEHELGWIWERTYGHRPRVRISDILQYASRPFVWHLSARTPALVIEYVTESGNPMPVPPGRGVVRGWIHGLIQPKDRVEVTEDGASIEHDYEMAGRHFGDGLPVWEVTKTKTSRDKDGRVVKDIVIEQVRTVWYATLGRDRQGRTVQWFHENTRPGKYRAFFMPGDTPWTPVEEDAAFHFQPKKGQTVYKTIRVRRKPQAASPSPSG